MNVSIIRYILSWVLTIESAFMFLPCLISILYREKSGFAFLAVAVVFLALGLVSIHFKPKSQQFFAKEGFVIVGLSWIVMSIVGCLPFVISREIPNFIDALFETVSGFTTTGASILSDVEALSHTCLFWRSFTHWIGGMGVCVFLIAILPTVGGYNMNLMKAESPGPSVGKLVPKVKDTAKILYLIYFIMTLVQFVLLMVAGMPWFDAICTAFGTAGTGGFGTKGDSLAGFNPAIMWITTIFMILFGMNFNLYFFILRKKFKPAILMEEIRWYVAIILLAIAVVTFNVLSYFDTVGEALTHSAFQVASLMTSTGFATTDFNLWPDLSRTILVMLMFIGACAGSTGGGLKVSRFILAIKAIRQEILHLIHPRSVKAVEMDGKAVDKETIKGVTVYISLFGIFYLISWLLISLNGFDFVTNFTAVVATLNNIGPGLNMVGPCGNFADFNILSKIVLMINMLAGRLELYPILLLFYPAVWKKN